MLPMIDIVHRWSQKDRSFGVPYKYTSEKQISKNWDHPLNFLGVENTLTDYLTYHIRDIIRLKEQWDWF